jgi:hypothetical protein
MAKCNKCGFVITTEMLAGHESLCGGNVTALEKYRTKKPEHVWECNCGGQLFWLNKDGTIECRSCKTVKTSLLWGYNT